MSILAPAQDPLPYQPIRIIDVSPYRSSLHSRPVPRVRRSLRRRVALVAGTSLAVVLTVAGVGSAAGPAPAEGFRLAPGHAMPASLMR
jgi:negative regulator of sigma E activity